MKVFDAYKAVVAHVLMAVLVRAKKCSVFKLSHGSIEMSMPQLEELELFHFSLTMYSVQSQCRRSNLISAIWAGVFFCKCERIKKVILFISVGYRCLKLC